MTHWLDTTVATAVLHEQMKSSTAYSYRTLTSEYVIPTVGSIRLDRLTIDDVDAMTAKMKKAGYKPNTIRLARSTLRSAMNAAVRARKIAFNPVTGSIAPRRSTEKRTPLTLDQARMLLKALDEKTYGPLIQVALWTGLRKGELLALLWSDVDLDGGSLMVDATLGRLTGEGLLRTAPKTEAAKDTVPLVESAVGALRRQRALQAAERLRLGARWRGGDYVFHGPIGGALDPSKALKEWNAIRDALEFPKVTFHDLRHTTATLLHEAGIPLEVIQRILRHSSITVTADIYTKVSEQLAASALSSYEAAITGSTESSAS